MDLLRQCTQIRAMATSGDNLRRRTGRDDQRASVAYAPNSAPKKTALVPTVLLVWKSNNECTSRRTLPLTSEPRRQFPHPVRAG